MVPEGRTAQTDRLLRPRPTAAAPRISEANTEDAGTRKGKGSSAPRGVYRRDPRDEPVNDYDRLLAEEGLILEATELLSELIERQAISRADLAARLGTTKSYITQLLAGSRNMTLRTLASAAYVLDAKIQLQAAPTAIATIRPPGQPVASPNCQVTCGVSTDLQGRPFGLAQGADLREPATAWEVALGSGSWRRALTDDNREGTSPGSNQEFSDRKQEQLPDAKAVHETAPGQVLPPTATWIGRGVVATGQGMAA